MYVLPAGEISQCSHHSARYNNTILVLPFELHVFGEFRDLFTELLL